MKIFLVTAVLIMVSAARAKEKRCSAENIEALAHGYKLMVTSFMKESLQMAKLTGKIKSKKGEYSQADLLKEIEALRKARQDELLSNPKVEKIGEIEKLPECLLK